MTGDGVVRLLLSAGRGPQEGAWAVGQLLGRLEAQAAGLGVRTRRTQAVPGTAPGTFRSVVVEFAGPGSVAFARSWSGTLCWQAPSPYRPGHGRKNWFVLAQEPTPAATERPFDPKEVDLVPCRTGGPGGQRRNKVSTAVRATHRPTGIVIVVDSERLLSANRRRALDLLRERVDHGNTAAERAADTARWRTHDRVVRGNPTRIERPDPTSSP